MDLITNFTKTLTDLLNKNEERFDRQSKLIEDLQKQLKDVMEKNNKLTEDYNRLKEENKKLDEQQNKSNDNCYKLMEENKKIIDQQNKISNDNERCLKEQEKLTENNIKLQNQIDVFNKHLRVEDISKWITVNHGLADVVLKLEESEKKLKQKLEFLTNANENVSKQLKEQQQQLSTLTTKLHSPTSRYGRYTQSTVGTLSPNAHNIMSGIIHNNNNSIEHQLYHHQPLYSSPHYVESIDPNDELGVISDQVDDLRRSVNELNILQRSFEKSNSIYSD